MGLVLLVQTKGTLEQLTDQLNSVEMVGGYAFDQLNSVEMVGGYAFDQLNSVEMRWLGVMHLTS